ncbi:MAG: sugar ABC transporter permease [Pseudomonadota bacterium]
MVPVTAAEAPRTRPRLWARLAAVREETALPLLFLSPTILLLGVFVYWPLLYTVYLSFVDWNFVADSKDFVGFENYSGILGSTLFNDAARNTLLYVVGSIPLKVLLPIPIAIGIWGLSQRMGDIYKTIIFLPTLISFVVVAIAFSWLLNPFMGIIGEMLRLVGLRMPAVFSDADLALWGILGISTWKIIGFNTLLYLAGLATINRDYVEAMRVDGASDGSIFRHLIWPMLTPTTFFVAIATVIFSLQQVFTPIDVLTQGGPSNSTTNLFYMVYQYAFVTFNVGFGSAGTVMLFALMIIVTLLKVKAFERWVHYQ